MLDTHCIPVSATEGDNVVTRFHCTPWYDGPTVLGYLENVDDTRLAVGSELRFPVQYVVRPQSASPAPWAARAPQVDGDYRGYAGKIESGGSGSARRSSSCRAPHTPWSRPSTHRTDRSTSPLPVSRW